ncbi:hypothetical protein GCM10011588_11440 [Nocardia jinanensis]|uniref:Uncharacterized protein n=1 Tax=Nocardia jinanensis TaxID=382504 RepID=A0A917RBI7_9NOCA|nr:hypothetical protein GCM10011588_11440 [Nocardia jinanensis]
MRSLPHRILDRLPDQSHLHAIRQIAGHAQCLADDPIDLVVGDTEGAAVHQHLDRSGFRPLGRSRGRLVCPVLLRWARYPLEHRLLEDLQPSQPLIGVDRKAVRSVFEAGQRRGDQLTRRIALHTVALEMLVDPTVQPLADLRRLRLCNARRLVRIR